ncbi:TlpA disulfide reductase family protein [Mucilaginibacter sp.]|uniref:TlpA disulfide reductase family protein n=1 Tax=Mucilaginibacter sp. TaxID=1882438 RepID=UPI00261A8F95|nr:TlpA disulfide reductase family protein [Mucilaginibacter sp.]MDB4926410.1 AhpC/TSA family protein [Mucilaginibacter sp.]
MKNIIAFFNFLALLSIGSICQAQSENANITIKGTVGNTTKTIYLQNYGTRTFHVLDSAKVIDGKFSFTRTLKYPEVYGLSIDTSAIAARTGQLHPDDQTLTVFVDNTNSITVEFDTVGHFKNSKVIGSTGNEIYKEFRKNKGANLEDFIRGNSKSIVPAYVLYRTYSSAISPDALKNDIDLLDPSLGDSQYVVDLNKLVETVPIGSKAIDFTLPDVNGKPVKLSSRFGKKYILLEFWASWCPVCRRENPNVVKNYQKYKDKGLDIFAVSLDRNKAAWLKGIKDYKLYWTQVSDLNLWDNSAARLYGFRALPSNVLIDRQGNIVAKNLSGDELDKKLAEVLTPGENN